MEALDKLQCQPCTGDAVALSNSESSKLLEQLTEWQIRNQEGTQQLVKEYVFKDFLQAYEFAGKVAALAENSQHHPAILLEWGKVTLLWWTHTIDGLHRNDFILAARSDLIAKNPQEFSTLSVN